MYHIRDLSGEFQNSLLQFVESINCNWVEQLNLTRMATF